MSDAIKAALESAAKRLCICDGECFETRHGMMNGPCEQSPSDAAAAIVAFLRALPLHNRLGDRRDYYPDRMADEVERAAKEGGDE